MSAIKVSAMQGFFNESLTVILRVPQKSVCHYKVSSIDRFDCIIIISIALYIFTSSRSSGSNVIAGFTGFFHLTHNVMITFVDCISFSWSSKTLTCGLTQPPIQSMPAFNNPGTTSRDDP